MDDEARVWRVALAGGENTHYPVLDRGDRISLQPRIPDVPGIETFAGRTIHTASWDDGYSLAGRRAAVIGTGSTGIQVIPEFAKEVAELAVFSAHARPSRRIAQDGIVHTVQRLQAAFTQRVLRWYTDTSLDFVDVALWEAVAIKKFVNRAISRASKLYRLLVFSDKELSRRLNPDFSSGCKRPTI